MRARICGAASFNISVTSGVTGGGVESSSAA
jgi:hypothetical protein